MFLRLVLGLASELIQDDGELLMQDDVLVLKV